MAFGVVGTATITLADADDTQPLLLDLVNVKTVVPLLRGRIKPVPPFDAVVTVATAVLLLLHTPPPCVLVLKIPIVEPILHVVKPDVVPIAGLVFTYNIRVLLLAVAVV
jgi:hypothetical protein